MLVMQSTPFCNIDCSYCYLPDRRSKRQMSDATLERVFERVFTSPFIGNHLTILWHAGEPLVPGTGYYERAFSILDRFRPEGLDIQHSFQTNATLLDQNWVDFFRAHNVSVGVSIDGPASFNDRNRVTRTGAGTFDKVMRGINMLRRNGYPFHVITVLTQHSIRAPRELFDFYIANDITKIGFNIEEIEGNHTSSSLSGGDADRAVREFYRAFLDLIEAHEAKLEIREFLGALGAIANPFGARYGNPMAEPLRTLSVAADGAISTFSPELLGYGSERHGSFSFGNVHENEIADILANPKFVAINSEIERGLAQCRQSCDYYEFCLGGSPVNKLFENDSFESTETLFCRLSKMAVIDVVLERSERALDLTS